MANQNIIEKQQVRGSSASIAKYAGKEGQIVFNKDNKRLHVMSGTAGQSTQYLSTAQAATKTQLGTKLDASTYNSEKTSFATKSQISTLATKAEVTSGLANKVNTRTYTADKATFALKTQIPDTSGLATKTQLSGYATTTALTQGLAGKANASHTHAIKNVIGLQDALDEKVSTTGNETISGTKTFASSPIVPEPTANTHVANKAYVDDAMGNVQGCPTGMIAFFHATTPPEGWLPCNGQKVSRTTYANLFAVIGTTYGSGDGSTTFTLPNLHHRFLEGTTTTSEVGKTVEAGLPNITGSVTVCTRNDGNDDRNEASGAFTLSDGGGRGDAYALQFTRPKWDFSATRSSSLYGGSSTVQPPAIRVLPCIKS